MLKSTQSFLPLVMATLLDFSGAVYMENISHVPFSNFSFSRFVRDVSVKLLNIFSVHTSTQSLPFTNSSGAKSV